MSNVGKIKVKSITDLVKTPEINVTSNEPKAKTTGRKRKTVIKNFSPPKRRTNQKLLSKTSGKGTQTLIDSYFKSGKENRWQIFEKQNPSSIVRKRLFQNPSTETAHSSLSKEKTITEVTDIIDLLSDSEPDEPKTIELPTPLPPPPLPPPSVKKTGQKTKSRPVPSYKIISGTSFAVDAFKYKNIEGVTHHFLTHFHADHYGGLTAKFSMPLYLSPITARLVRTFIKVEDQYLNELEINEPQIIDGVEVTAIDANHCPGAVMFIFKLATGKCILHTGDFRASPQMESEPIFWNNDIDTIYLDTTYINTNNEFSTQSESVDSAKRIVKEFERKKKSEGKRILYICGSYVIGKEKFWSALAKEFNWKVWAENSRDKALNAMAIPEYTKLLCKAQSEANMHLLPIDKVNYMTLLEYFDNFKDRYDVLLAFRPRGWETKSRPQLRGIINIVGIGYSEHSSYNEMQRFVKFLKPNEVISTVPSGRNPMKTSHVPSEWYNYTRLNGKHCFQTNITSFMMQPKNTNIKENKEQSNAIIENTQVSIKCSPTKTPNEDVLEENSMHVTFGTPKKQWKNSNLKVNVTNNDDDDKEDGDFYAIDDQDDDWLE